MATLELFAAADVGIVTSPSLVASLAAMMARAFSNSWYADTHRGNETEIRDADSGLAKNDTNRKSTGTTTR